MKYEIKYIYSILHKNAEQISIEKFNSIDYLCEIDLVHVSRLEEFNDAYTSDRSKPGLPGFENWSDV